MRSVSKLELIAVTVAMASTAIAALLYRRLVARFGDQLTVSLAPVDSSRVEGSNGKRRIEITIDRDPQQTIS